MSRTGKCRSLTSVEEILAGVMSDLKLDKRLKEQTLMSLWPAVIGDKFAKRSRPLFIDAERNLVISVSEAAIAQELSLLKPQIIQSLKMAASGLAISINGIRFDLKHFHGSEKDMGEPPAKVFLREEERRLPNDEELQGIELSEEDRREVAKLRESVRLLGGENQERLSERIVTLMEKELRTRKWLSANGSPLCPRCQTPCARLHGENNLCAYCYYLSICSEKEEG